MLFKYGQQPRWKIKSAFKQQLSNICSKSRKLSEAPHKLKSFSERFLTTLFLPPVQTPMNQASTRSHCIFTVHLCRCEPGSATLRRSKLHLVDLAGSDRVSKTGLNGQLLTEAKYINLSLHYLEQVTTSLATVLDKMCHVEMLLDVVGLQVSLVLLSIFFQSI